MSLFDPEIQQSRWQRWRQAWRAVRPVVLTAGSALVGWGLVTTGLVLATGFVWIAYISAGVLLLGLAGWKFVWEMLTLGLFVSSKLAEGPVGQESERRKSA